MPLMILLALLLGIAVCLQGTANGQLAGRIGLPLTLTVNSGMVFLGALCWLAIAHFSGSTPPERGDASWKLYTGGLFGLVIISCAAVAYPRLGAGVTTTLAVGAQVVTALVLDQLGATGRHVPLTPARLAGVACVALGVWLVMRPAPTPTN